MHMNKISRIWFYDNLVDFSEIAQDTFQYTI